MAALRALIGGELPPVGQRIRWAGAAEPPPQFPGFEPVWTSSGTAALALALHVARERRSAVPDPKVLFPAYGCPDLVAAAVHAGAEPVLVDVRPDEPGFDDDALVRAWTDDVVAVVAVNFLGLRERLAAIRPLARARDALLLEDCAQWYPEGELDADAIVLSFGRGKPVNLLGGGALLLAARHCTEPPTLAMATEDRRFRLRAAAMNALLARRPFAWASRLPFVTIGATQYKPLRAVASIDPARLGMLSANVGRWLGRPRWREDMLRDGLADAPSLVRLPVTLEERAGRLLRYPVLMADRPARDRALQALTDRGLGASALYGSPLPDVRDVPPTIAVQGPFPNARRFADRLLTLPLHDGVTPRDLAAIMALLGGRRAPEAPVRQR